MFFYKLVKIKGVLTDPTLSKMNFMLYVMFMSSFSGLFYVKIFGSKKLQENFKRSFRV